MRQGGVRENEIVSSSGSQTVGMPFKDVAEKKIASNTAARFSNKQSKCVCPKAFCSPDQRCVHVCVCAHTSKRACSYPFMYA